MAKKMKTSSSTSSTTRITPPEEVAATRGTMLAPLDSSALGLELVVELLAGDGGPVLHKLPEYPSRHRHSLGLIQKPPTGAIGWNE